VCVAFQPVWDLAFLLQPGRNAIPVRQCCCCARTQAPVLCLYTQTTNTTYLVSTCLQLVLSKGLCCLWDPALSSVPVPMSGGRSLTGTGSGDSRVARKHPSSCSRS
jgi:hypothetical protein